MTFLLVGRTVLPLLKLPTSTLSPLRVGLLHQRGENKSVVPMKDQIEAGGCWVHAGEGHF